MNISQFIYNDEEIAKILGKDYIDVLEKHNIYVSSIDPNPRDCSKGTYGIKVTVWTQSYGDVDLGYRCPDPRIMFPNVFGINHSGSGELYALFHHRAYNDFTAEDYEVWEEIYPALREARFELQEIRNNEVLGADILSALKGEDIAVVSVGPSGARFEALLPPCNGYMFVIKFTDLENGNVSQNDIIKAFKDFAKQYDPEKEAKKWCIGDDFLHNRGDFSRDYEVGLRGTTAIKERLERSAAMMKPQKKRTAEKGKNIVER